MHLYEKRKHIFFIWNIESLDLINIKMFKMFKIFKILNAFVKSIIIKVFTNLLNLSESLNRATFINRASLRLTRIVNLYD